MANIRIDLTYEIKDGTKIVFRSPCDCTEITGLIVYYVKDGAQKSKQFMLADAHGENVGDIPHLFASDAVVKVILDVTSGMAFVQNADTNAYIEKTFVKTVNNVAPDGNGNVALTVSSTTGTTVPDGWQTALETGADAMRLAVEEAGRNKSAFLFYTDAHWTSNKKYSPQLLRYLQQNTPINKIIFGGDIVDEEPDDAAIDDRKEMEYLWEWRKAVRDLPNHHSVAGNHDDGNPTTIFEESYVYAYLLAPEENNDVVHGDNTYYYIDDKCEKTRYLFLDTGFKGLDTLSAAQSQFITESLNSTPDGWHIVVVSHVWYTLDYDRYSERPVPLKGMTTPAKGVAALLDSYNASRSSTDAKVEFCIGGHIHYDYVDETDGGIPIICCETDSTHTRGTFAYNSGNKLTHSAVSGIVANYTDRTVSVIRVGRGESFVVNIDNPTMKANYTITKNLTNVASSSSVVQVEEGDAFSTTLTATVGEMVSVTVTMGGTNITSSAYNSSTGVITISAVTGNVVITAVAESNEPAYTNVLETVGYENGRINSSGQFKTDRTDRWTTGFIEAPTGSVVYFKNITMLGSDYGRNIAFYDSAKTFITGKSYVISDSSIHATWNDDGTLKSFRIAETGVGFVRFCFVNIDGNSIITVNEPIN